VTAPPCAIRACSHKQHGLRKGMAGGRLPGPGCVQVKLRAGQATSEGQGLATIHVHYGRTLTATNTMHLTRLAIKFRPPKHVGNAASFPTSPPWRCVEHPTAQSMSCLATLIARWHLTATSCVSPTNCSIVGFCTSSPTAGLLPSGTTSIVTWPTSSTSGLCPH
jgi:hypothetical protein